MTDIDFGYGDDDVEVVDYVDYNGDADHDELAEVDQSQEASEPKQIDPNIGKSRKFLRSYSRNSVQSSHQSDHMEEGQSNAKPEDKVESVKSRKSRRSTSSHQVSENNANDKDDFVKKMRDMLRKIFQFYASFGNRCNSRYMKPSQFIKMMLDADIVDHGLSQTKLDILFLQACKKSKTLEFDDFLELLLLVASKKFKKEGNPDASLRQLLTKYIEPLFLRIMNETDAGIEEKILNAPISVSSLLLLRMINKPLQAIYKHYLNWEINRPLQEKPSMAKVESELFLFLKEFEVCPQLVAKASAHSIFTQVLNTKTEELCKNAQYPDLAKILGKDLGEMFTYFRFVVYLSRLGIFVFSDINNVPSTHRSVEFTNDEKVYLLFERMDISSGVAKVLPLLMKDKNASSGANTHKLSLSRESLEHIHRETNAYPHFFEAGDEDQPESRLSKLFKSGKDQNKSGKDYKDEEEFMYIKMAKRASRSKLSPRSNSGSIALSRKGTRRTLINNNRSNKENVGVASNREVSIQQPEDSGPNLVIPESYDICETYLDELHKLFEAYCSFGEPGNYSVLKSAKFHKIMKDARVLDAEGGNILESHDVELIYCSVLHGLDPFSNHSKKRAKALLLKFKNDQSTSRSKSPSKGKSSPQGLNFSMFLQSLEAVALCVERSSNKIDRLGTFINKRLIPLLADRPGMASRSKSSSTIRQKLGDKDHFTDKLVSMLKDKLMIDMLASLHKTMLPIYQLYCEDNRLITGKKFLQFMKDFGVFPQLVSQSKLLQLFHELNNLYKSKVDCSELKEESIDQHLFIEGMALVALEVEYDKFKLTNSQKLILLLERMNDSDATQKLSRYLGRTISKKFDIVSQIRLRFADHFKF